MIERRGTGLVDVLEPRGKRKADGRGRGFGSPPMHGSLQGTLGLWKDGVFWRGTLLEETRGLRLVTEELKEVFQSHVVEGNLHLHGHSA